jgi:hypothetical protein
MDGALKGRSYKLDQPTRTLVALELPAISYRHSLAHALTGTHIDSKGTGKAKKAMLAKVVQKFAVGTNWRLCRNGDGDVQHAVQVKGVNAEAHVFVQRMIGKPTIICVKDPIKSLRTLPK